MRPLLVILLLAQTVLGSTIVGPVLASSDDASGCACATGAGVGGEVGASAASPACCCALPAPDAGCASGETRSMSTMSLCGCASPAVPGPPDAATVPAPRDAQHERSGSGHDTATAHPGTPTAFSVEGTTSHRDDGDAVFAADASSRAALRCIWRL